MSSGYFPLWRTDGWGVRLERNISDLQALRSEIADASRELDVPEDALYDGMRLGEMAAAISMLGGLLRQEARDG